MSKSAVLVAREALTVGRRALPRYATRYSKHTDTQAQLFALLVLRQFLRTDYRGVVTLVAEWTEVRRALGLTQAPHYSTLCYAERRLLADAEKGGPSIALRLLSSRGPAPRADRRRADGGRRRHRT